MKLITIKKAAVFAVAAVLTAGALSVVFSGSAIAVTGACNTYKLTITPTTETGDSAQIVGFFSETPTGFNVDAYPNLSTVTVASLSGTSSAGSFVGVPDGQGGYQFKSAAGVTLISATALGCDTPTTPPPPLIAVTATPVTFVDATCTDLIGYFTVPVTPHVTYIEVTSTNPVPDGTFQAAVPSTLDIRAIADAGYKVATPNEWQHDFKVATNCSAKPPVKKTTTKPPVKKTTTTPPVKKTTTTPPVKTTTTGVNPLPISGHAGQADTNGQLAEAGLAGGIALALMTAGGVIFYRRQRNGA